MNPPKINPAFRALIPPLFPDELAQLEANIVADGCRDPLVTWRGQLLDGHNRLDTRQVYLVCFQLLRIAFRSNLADWRRSFKTDVQTSDYWESECIFVPATTVYEAMRRASIGRLRLANQAELPQMT